MASITLDRVTVDFPIYNARKRSLKSELFRRAVGDHDARCGGGFLVESFHDHAVVQGA